MTKSIRIVGSGAVCAIGVGVAQIWASVRAGISRSASSAVHDKTLDPITMALLPEDALPGVPAEVQAHGLTARQERLLWLARPALQEALAGSQAAEPMPLFLALPEWSSDEGMFDTSVWLKLLADAHPAAVDVEASQVFCLGRAAGFHALAAACAYLQQGRGRVALVGGVDSYLDLSLLNKLDDEERILSARVNDGFIPGEGAACLLLTTEPGNEGVPSTIVLGACTAEDPGHRYADAPAKGEGLANAVEKLRAQMPPPRAAAGVVFAGLNGESFGAKEWGITNMRHGDLLSPEAML